MLSPVCLSSVTYMRPTQAVQIFSNISVALGTLAYTDIHWKFYGDRPRGTPPPGELNTRGVAKYSDFGPIDAISRKRCKIGGKLVLTTNRKSYEFSIGTRIGDLERRVMAVILRYFSELGVPSGRTASKFTFAISSPDEFLYVPLNTKF